MGGGGRGLPPPPLPLSPLFSELRSAPKAPKRNFDRNVIGAESSAESFWSAKGESGGGGGAGGRSPPPPPVGHCARRWVRSGALDGRPLCQSRDASGVCLRFGGGHFCGGGAQCVAVPDAWVGAAPVWQSPNNQPSSQPTVPPAVCALGLPPRGSRCSALRRPCVWPVLNPARRARQGRRRAGGGAPGVLVGAAGVPRPLVGAAGVARSLAPFPPFLRSGSYRRLPV